MSLIVRVFCYLVALIQGFGIGSLRAEEFCFLQPYAKCADGQTDPGAIAWNGSDDLRDLARRACMRAYGGSSSLQSVDQTRGVIYCRTSQGRHLEQIRVEKVAKKKVPEPRSKDVNSDPAGSEPTSKVGGCVGGACSENRPRIPEVSLGEPTINPRVLEKARVFCVQKWGPTSTVAHIDYNSWQISCKH